MCNDESGNNNNNNNFEISIKLKLSWTVFIICRDRGLAWYDSAFGTQRPRVRISPIPPLLYCRYLVCLSGVVRLPRILDWLLVKYSVSAGKFR